MKKILLSLLMSLMSETFAKEVILLVLKWLVDTTKTVKDNEAYDLLKKNWKM